MTDSQFLESTIDSKNEVIRVSLVIPASPSQIFDLLASPAGHAAGRASLVAFFMLTDITGLLFLAREGLVTTESGLLALAFLPAHAGHGLVKQKHRGLHGQSTTEVDTLLQTVWQFTHRCFAKGLNF